MRQPIIALGVLVLLTSVSACPTLAMSHSDRAAAIINFPYLVLDSSRGVDTLLRLSNADGAAPVDVACFLENTTPHCALNPLQACATGVDCPAGDTCDIAQLAVVPFTFRLTARQPVSWNLSAGLQPLPVPAAGSIPAAPEDPFVGALRCIAVDADGAPAARDVLLGGATLERYVSSADLLDAAQYNGIGLAAVPGSATDDGRLILGGPEAEYEGCPAVLILNHFFDGALDPVAPAATLATTLVLIPCGAELWRSNPPDIGPVTMVQYLIRNEFEQRFSTSTPLRAQFVKTLSTIDTANPMRSLFSAGVVGTLAGQTQIRGATAGIMGIAVQAHVDADIPARVSSAAFNLHADGAHPASDTIQTAFGCPPRPVVGCRAAETNRLLLRERAGDGGDRVRWEWRKGQATNVLEFGDPLHETHYVLCAFAGDATGRTIAWVPASSSRWSPAARGFIYADRSGSADGVVRLGLLASTRRRARVSLDARGANLRPLGVDTPLQTPVVVQLLRSDTDACFESVFESADVRHNEPGTFEARSR